MLAAKDIMTREVVTVTAETPVRELAQILWEKRISGVPVVDDEGRVTSVVTENDLIDQNKKVHIPTVMTLLDSFIYLESPEKAEKELRKMAGKTVKDICSEKLVTIDEDTPLEDIASIMADKRVHTLPVLAGTELVGVVGKSDIIKTLTRS